MRIGAETALECNHDNGVLWLDGRQDLAPYKALSGLPQGNYGAAVSDENAVVLKLVQRLREIREAKGISQYRLSKETGLSASGIRHMENGEVSPTLYFLLRVCGYLKEDLPTLLSDALTTTCSPEKPPSP